MPANEPMYNLSFPLMGRGMTKRWHYPFYAAICTALDDRLDPSVGIYLSGSPLPISDRIYFNDETSLVMRAPASSIPALASFVGKQFDVAGDTIRLGAFRLFQLKPAQRLYSRMVTFNGGMEPEVFKAQCLAHLKEMGVSTELTMPCYVGGVQVGNPQRRLLEIKGRKIVGFTVMLSNLSDQDSLKVQSLGLGGRRHMGCGVFTPCR